MLLEEAGAIPATPGMVNSGQQMLLQKSGIMPQFAPGGKVVSGLAKFLEESKIPQRLYHGTTASEEKGAKALSQLKQSKEGALGSGVYMTPNPEFASQYANEAGGYVMPVHTNLRNPLEIHSTSGVGGNGDPMKLALMQLGVPEAKAEKIIEDAYEKRGYIGKEVMSRAQKQGYDGIAQYRDGNLNEVVSYNPYNIKSATGNSGEFNPYDPRLSKAEGGHIEISPQDMLAELLVNNYEPQQFAAGGKVASDEQLMAIIEMAKRQPGFLKKGAAKALGLTGKMFNRLNPAFQTMAAVDAGEQVMDTLERAHQGDYRGAALSGIGAMGAGVGMLPGWIPQAASIPLSMGASYAQNYFDETDPHESRFSLKNTTLNK